MDIYVLTIIISIVLISSNETLTKLKPKLETFYSLTVIITLLTLVVNYINNEREKIRNIEVSVVKDIDDKVDNIELLFLDRRNLDELYLDVKGKREISEEEYKKPDIQQMLVIIMGNLNEFAILRNNNNFNVGLIDRIRNLFRQKSIRRFYEENREKYSKELEKYYYSYI